MSQENLELTRRAFDAIVRRDLDAFVDHGCAGVREWWDDFLGAFPDFSFHVDDVRELGDRTLTRVRVSGHGAHTMDSADPMIDQVNWILGEMRDGRLIRWGSFRTEAEALEAVGLRE
jgi:ketosteroid isomerase-like protein